MRVGTGAALFERLLAWCRGVGRKPQARGDDAHDHDLLVGKLDRFERLADGFEAYTAGTGKVASRGAQGVVVELYFDHDQVAIARLGARIDAHGVARVQSQTRERLIANPVR